MKEIEIQQAKAGIAAQKVADKNLLAFTQLSKIQCLSELLAATIQENTSEFSPLLPVISDEINRALIEGKIVELVKTL